MKTKELRIGLIGVGGIAAFVHYPGLSLIEGVTISGVCDPDADLVARRQKEWGVNIGYTDALKFLDEVALDAVVVATPNVYHEPIVQRALEHGCHVLCEKPLSMSAQATRSMYLAARSAGLRHMTAFTYRFVPALAYIKSLIQRGELGEIRHARFKRLHYWGEVSLGWRQYRKSAGSGELGDVGSHRADFAEDILGPIASVCASMKQVIRRTETADGKACDPQDVEDWVAWIAEFASGATGVFEMGKLSNGRGPKGDDDVAEFEGSQASAVYQLHDPTSFLWAARGDAYERRAVPEGFLKRPGSPRDPGAGDPFQTFRFDQAWEFVSAIREERDCSPTFWHGVRAQIVTEAIQAAATSRRWIDIPPGIGVEAEPINEAAAAGTNVRH